MLVKLQRPPPEIRIFRPGCALCSSSSTRRPRCPATAAHIKPGGARTQHDHIEFANFARHLLIVAEHARRNPESRFNVNEWQDRLLRDSHLLANLRHAVRRFRQPDLLLAAPAESHRSFGPASEVKLTKLRHRFRQHARLLIRLRESRIEIEEFRISFRSDS